MDSTKLFEIEMDACAVAANEQTDALSELSALQLSLVGGGIGDVQHG
jgi:hypothetical protein